MTQPLCTWCDRASFFSVTSKKMIKLEASEIKNISFQGYLQLFPLKILLTIRSEKGSLTSFHRDRFLV